MKILFLSPWYPTPPVNGSKMRIYHLLKAAAESYEVVLLSFTRSGEVLDLGAAEYFCSEVHTVPFREFQPGGWKARMGYLSWNPRSVVDTYSPAMAQAARRLASDVDGIVASEILTAPYARQTQDIPCILDDLELAAGWDAWQRALGFMRIRRWLTWQKTRGYVRRMLPGFKAVTVVSNVEKTRLEDIASDYADVRILPNGVDTEYNQPGLSLAVAGRLVYSGALSYTANYDAVKYFLDTIFPLIRKEQPMAHLVVTGNTEGVDLSALQLDAHVQFSGFVADIRSVVAAACVCVVPLRHGSGTRLKILEAMALGTPVVATSKGAEGLDVTPEIDILLADEPVEFARQVIRLLKNEDLRHTLAGNGRRLVEQHYSWGKIGKDFRTLLREIMD